MIMLELDMCTVSNSHIIIQYKSLLILKLQCAHCNERCALFFSLPFLPRLYLWPAFVYVIPGSIRCPTSIWIWIFLFFVFRTYSKVMKSFPVTPSRVHSMLYVYNVVLQWGSSLNRAASLSRSKTLYQKSHTFTVGTVLSCISYNWIQGFWAGAKN